jgi:hypothetical protein
MFVGNGNVPNLQGDLTLSPPNVVYLPYPPHIEYFFLLPPQHHTVCNSTIAIRSLLVAGNLLKANLLDSYQRLAS